jgi:hypothetical protein
MSILMTSEILATELTDEQLGEEWENLSHLEEQVKEYKAYIRDEALFRMDERGVNSFFAGNKMIKDQSRNIYSDVELETARKFGAVKMEEKVDTTMLGSLIKKGAEVPGVRVTRFIKVENIENE